MDFQISSESDSPDMSLNGGVDEGGEECCSLCEEKFNQPRVLPCLHVFCENCLKGYEKNDSCFISCPDCQQECKLGPKGVAGLPLDYITCNRIDLKAMEKAQLICTSCKAKENAVARCTECATFLCPNCVTAHQFMRCFESHTVLSFEELKSSGETFTTIHKPMTCSSHPDEAMKYYCYTCHVPICNECMVIDHKQPEHIYEKAADAEQKQREKLEKLIAESRSKVKFCNDASTSLSTHLSELEMQRDNAKSHIEETFQSYKATLEKFKEKKLEDLGTIHAAQEIQVMEMHHNVTKTIDKIEDGCKFADRLLTCGNTLEILSLTYMVGSQLMSLINNTPKLDISVGINFETDEVKFEESIQQTFGSLKGPKPPSPPPPPVSPPAKKGDVEVSPLQSSGSSFDNELAMAPDMLMMSRYNLGMLLDLERGLPPDENTTILNNLSSLLCQTTEPDPASAQFNALKNLTALAMIGDIALDDPQPPEDMASSMFTGLPKHFPVKDRSNDAPTANSSPSPTGSLESLFGNGTINSSSRVESPMSLLNGGSMLNSPNAAPPLRSSFFEQQRNSSQVKVNTMQIRCKFGQLGPGKSQFSSPHGFCLGIDEEIIVADTNNHRIQVFEKTGDFKYQFGVAGKEEGQLWYPRKVAVVRSSAKFVVCDRGSERSRMQIFTKIGHFLKKIAIRYIDIVAGLAITAEGNIVAVDSVAPTVFVISETGDLLHWFDCSEYMREPSDIAVCGKEFYICDFKGHCVIVFSAEGKYMRKIGYEYVTNFPNGIDISDAGDVLVGDSHGNRFHIVVFTKQGQMISEFECPYVKVSRCCGLKITSEGYVVTLAKNNHHVLVLNTLYIV